MPGAVIPVLAGAAQLTQGPGTSAPQDPARLMARVCREALADAGPRAATACDGLYVVRTMSLDYADIAGDVARRAGIAPVESLYAATGGNTPQTLLFRAASAVAAGRLRAVLICGAEASFSVRRVQREGAAAFDWPAPAPPPPAPDPDPPAYSPHEMENGVFAPSYAYAYFENAMRAHLGLDHESHRRLLGRICERLSNVSAQNPYAWNRKALSADEITLPGPDNRMVGYPYTLRMNANIFVDMAAAVLVMGEDTARDLGVSSDRLVYPLSGATLENVWNVSRRPLLHDAPALRAAARLALAGAGKGVEDVSLFDFYSCFPWAVEAALMELGVPQDDPRPVSLTGGLPCFGGPGNNYSTHALAEVVARVREDRSQTALVTSLGWYNTRWAVGLYGGSAPKDGFHPPETARAQAAIWAASLPEPVEQAEGPFSVESAVVWHDRSGAPEHAGLVGRLSDGRRAFARTDAAAADLADWEKDEIIGLTGRVRHDPERRMNIFGM